MGENEEVEKLRRSRSRVEKRITRLKAELDHLTHILSVIDKHLAEREKAEAKPPEAKPAAPEEKVTPKPPPVSVQAIPLVAASGVTLGTLYLGENEIRVIPSRDLEFNVNTPPFNQFLITKVLAGMVTKDREEAVAGAITPDEILTYRVMREGDILKELVIRNYREEKRAVTLKNSIRWTLEKMYEKMKT
ncbi:hypothetical protein [Candidatus Hecatella orcuttiae]|uniref:hypothetical protein n=1 Tax=Candidatus Hecatella orcuttiae TaxID=1935119 RepID=UPI00286833ED|nr:hypothetical protein [Candidatus Hecatella orcuttiae]